MSDRERLRELRLKDEEKLTAEERIEKYILGFQAAFRGRRVYKIFVHPKTFGLKTPEQVRGVPVVKSNDVEIGRIKDIAY